MQQPISVNTLLQKEQNLEGLLKAQCNFTFSDQSAYCEVVSLTFLKIKSLSNDVKLLYYSKVAIDYLIISQVPSLENLIINHYEHLSTVIAKKVMEIFCEADFSSDDEEEVFEDTLPNCVRDLEHLIDHALNSLRQSPISPYEFISEDEENQQWKRSLEALMEFYLSAAVSIGQIPSLIFWSVNQYLRQQNNQNAQIETEQQIASSFDSEIKLQSHEKVHECFSSFLQN